MLIRELGEFALIARLQRHLQAGGGSQIIRGVGDDCAILRPTAGMDLLLTTDTQEEDIHFRRQWSTPQDIGWRCLAVNVSDIAAMGGTPLGAVVALSLPPDLEVAFVEALYDGMQALATAYACPIIGGNISKTTTALAVTITVLGEVPHGRSVCRSGARAGDEIWVTGDLGGARAGLEVLRRPAAVAGRPAAGVLARYRRPCPRLREAHYLQRHATLHSLIDLSDGLSSDLTHICEASGVGARLAAAVIPMSAEVRQLATALGVEPLTFALHGGEDFELCLTAPPGEMDRVHDAFVRQFHGPLTRIGSVHTGSGITLCQADGSQSPLAAGGYDHFHPATDTSASP